MSQGRALRCLFKLWFALPLACSADPALSARDAADANDTGRTLAARSESERTLLGRVASLPDGATQRIGDATVTAEPAYSAASGRSCRVLHVTTTGTPSNRLACSDGNAWYFVPDVFPGAAPGKD